MSIKYEERLISKKDATQFRTLKSFSEKYDDQRVFEGEIIEVYKINNVNVILNISLYPIIGNKKGNLIIFNGILEREIMATMEELNNKGFNLERI